MISKMPPISFTISPSQAHPSKFGVRLLPFPGRSFQASDSLTRKRTLLLGESDKPKEVFWSLVAVTSPLPWIVARFSAFSQAVSVTQRLLTDVPGAANENHVPGKCLPRP